MKIWYCVFGAPYAVGSIIMRRKCKHARLKKETVTHFSIEFLHVSLFSFLPTAITTELPWKLKVPQLSLLVAQRIAFCYMVHIGGRINWWYFCLHKKKKIQISQKSTLGWAPFFWIIFFMWFNSFGLGSTLCKGLVSLVL